MYIDFGYFGWDDPVKLTSDFIWHAGMVISNHSPLIWRFSTHFQNMYALF